MRRIAIVPCTALMLVWPSDVASALRQSDQLQLRPRATIDGAATDFGRIGAVTADAQGRIYVADVQEGAQQIVVFSEAGRELGRVGRRGQGPGEFQRLSPTLAWTGDTLVAIESWGGQRRVSFFNIDGRPIRAVSLSPAPAGHAVGNVQLFSGWPRLYMLEVIRAVTRIDLNQTSTLPEPSVAYYEILGDRTFGPLAGVRDSAVMIGGSAEQILCTSADSRAWSGFDRPFSDRGPLRAFLPSGHLAMGSRNALRVDIVDAANGRVLRSHRQQVSQVRVTNEIWNTLPEVRAIRRYEERYGGPLKALGRDNAPCPIYNMRPQFQPVLRSVLSDETGRIWVEFTTDQGFALGGWSTDGRWLGSAAMPARDPRVAPFIRDNRLYIVTLGAFDVQGLRSFDIITASEVP